MRQVLRTHDPKEFEDHEFELTELGFRKVPGPGLEPDEYIRRLEMDEDEGLPLYILEWCERGVP